MKKLFLPLGLTVATFFSIGAMADYRHNDYRDNDYRIITVTGIGKGGTTTGDKDAARERAFSRAERDAVRNCERKDGYVLGFYYDFYDDSSCKKKSGTRDDYNCEAWVQADCEVERGGRRRRR